MAISDRDQKQLDMFREITDTLENNSIESLKIIINKDGNGEISIRITEKGDSVKKIKQKINSEWGYR